MLENLEKDKTETGQTMTETPPSIRKKLPPGKKFVPISDSIIGSTIATDNNEITKIAEDLALSNEEKVELLQDLITVKQAKMKSLSQPAAQRRYWDAINTAKQYK